MRQKGLGYREIAKALGADRKNICKACKRLGVAYTEEEAQERNGNNPISEETAKERFEASCPGFRYISGYELNTSRVLIRRVACGHEFLYTYSQACARGADLTCQVCRKRKGKAAHGRKGLATGGKAKRKVASSPETETKNRAVICCTMGAVDLDSVCTVWMRFCAKSIAPTVLLSKMRDTKRRTKA